MNIKRPQWYVGTLCKSDTNVKNKNDKMANDDPLDFDRSQEANYTPIRVLGRGAFGEAILYRRIEVG